MSGTELYKKYRPSKLSELVGQKEAVKTLIDMGMRNAIPHTMLFVGGPGCGKTTTARILRSKLKCSEADFHEYNSADFRGIDTIRDIRQRMSLAPISGKTRIYMIDECHQLTPQAQESALKILEDTPSHVYFILCTTDPQKLKPTIRSRCTEIKFKPLGYEDAKGLLESVAEKEGIALTEKVADTIVENSNGSARNLLVLLHQIAGLESEEERLAVVSSVDAAQAIELARILVNQGGSFKKAAAILSKLEDDPETVRWLVLGYAKTVLLKGSSQRAYAVLNAFRDNFYDSKMAGLTAACYECFLE